MTVWEVDFYRRPLQDKAGNLLWELLVCDRDGNWRFVAVCPQAEATVEWLVSQFRQIDRPLPDQLQVFRPQTFNLLEPVGEILGIAVEPTRHTPALKRWLQERSQEYLTLSNYTGQPYDPLSLDKPPPVPVSEQLMGDRWQFATLAAEAVEDAFTGRMIPVVDLPEEFLPLKLGLASTTPIPGVVIEGGRQSRRLVQWLQSVRPVALNYISGAPDGLILEAGLIDRWVLFTFEDAEVKTAAQVFEQRKQVSQGLHFLLVQPDNTGMTYSGVWLLRS